jgi:hypothetical protein
MPAHDAWKPALVFASILINAGLGIARVLCPDRFIGRTSGWTRNAVRWSGLLMIGVSVAWVWARNSR